MGVVFCEALSCVWSFGVMCGPCMFFLIMVGHVYVFVQGIINIIDLCLLKKKSSYGVTFCNSQIVFTCYQILNQKIDIE